MRSETEIQREVMEELEWEAVMNANSVKPTAIGVAVTKGIVTLSGTVDSYTKKSAAEKAVMRVAGVKAVANEIEVRLSSIYNKNDTEIAEAILNAIKWSTSIPEAKIKVKVQNGWITLEGEVEWEFQKRAARKVVEDLIGVKGVENEILVVSKVATPQDIKEKIKAAFKRNYYLDFNKINVDINGSTAILKGEVRTLAEKIAAENAAWCAPGIIRVDNKLEVNYAEVFA